MRTIFGIAVLAAVGAIARHLVDGWVANRFGTAFPVGTLVVNVSGCLLLGFLFPLLTERVTVDPSLRFALTTGFVGAYTTFSTFSLETVRLLQDGELGAAVLNVGASVALGLIAVYAGLVIARAVA